MKRSSLLAAASVALVATLALAGCSIIPADSGSPAPRASQGAGGLGGAAGGTDGAAFPGVVGQVAAVDGSTAQVQSRSSQTAVTWTATTAFTAQVAASPSDVAVGDCVVARPAATARGTSATSSGTVAAATIEITPSTDGRCSATGFAARPGGGQLAGGSGGTRPSARPSAAPGRGRGGFGAAGRVTAVGDGSYTVSVERFRRAAGASPAPSATPQTAAETVTWTAATVFTAVKKADASAVRVGTCVTALGKTDDTGALTASSIAVTQPVDGSCSSGFGRGGFGATGGGGAGTTNG